MSESNREVRLAIVDNSIFPDIYRPVEHWSRYIAAEWESFPARDSRFPDLSRFTHLLLTGSESSILERESWVEREADLVNEAVQRGVPVLGSCWGHQLLVYALAGFSHIRRCPVPEIGWISMRILRESEILGPPGEVHVFSVHYDEVCDLDETFEVLASSDNCCCQAFRVKDRPVWGLQCHPEVDVETGQTFLHDLLERNFKGAEYLKQALLSPPRDSGIAGEIVASFIGVESCFGKA